MNYPELVGGAFSGTALVDEEQKLRLFFTRHIGKRRDRTAFREYQVMTESRDGLNWERETGLLKARRAGISGTRKYFMRMEI